MSTEVEVDVSVLSDLEFEITCEMNWFRDDSEKTLLPSCENPATWQVDYISHMSDHEPGSSFCCDNCLIRLRAWAEIYSCHLCKSYGFFKNVVRIK